jgi:hypothetical protein
MGMMPSTLAIVAAAAMALGATACHSKGADVAGQRLVALDAGLDMAEATEVAAAPPPAARAPASGTRPRVVARSASRALALDGAHVYFGDAFEDTLESALKDGGASTRLARRAPVAGGLAIDGDTLSWVATPGDIVLHEPTSGGAAIVLREQGIFADVAASDGEAFIVEAQGSGGVLMRISGVPSAAALDAGAKASPRATRLAAFDGAPRAVVVDATSLYVATAQKILRVPRSGGAAGPETVALGSDFESPVLDGDYVYVVTASGSSGGHDVVRVAKTGGPTATIAKNVRAAPIAVDSGDLLYFDAQRPRLLAMPLSGGAPRVLAQDDALSRPNAIATDADAVYVAAGERDDGIVLAVPRR